MKKYRWIIVLLLLLLLAGGMGLWKSVSKKGEEPAPVANVPTEPVVVTEATPIVAVKATPIPDNLKPVKEVKEAKATPAATPTPAALAPEAPPPIQIHKELIPKDIEIVRVYYGQQLTGPGSIVEFDINGSGFNTEFEKMITVESGSPAVAVKNLKLMTPNQIHGVLVIKSDAPTGAVFPQVLIQNKVVFRAPEPFAVIRPAEVLNFIFTEMGENGRSGRFRVFTNLSEDMYSVFSVSASTTVIQVSDVVPHLPFVVDGTITIGGAANGSYGITVKLGQKTIWNRDGIIQVVQPNVGQSGLTQQLRATDGFHRPGDSAKFILYGSGFQPNDVNLLRVEVEPFGDVLSALEYKSPGRMELNVIIPKEAEQGPHKVTVLQGKNILMAQDKAFVVIGKNWTRELGTVPALKVGSKGMLRLTGRDLDKSFIGAIQVEVDSDELKVGQFSWVSATEAKADVSVGAGLQPGDYLIKMTSNGSAVQPQFGSIIKINP